MAEQPLRILVVCTANQCRSPMAAAIAQDRLDAHQIPAVVTSAGVAALEGIAATENAELTMAKLNLDISDHEACHVEHASVPTMDTIWCMERRHAVEIGARWPEMASVTFTLLDLAARARHAHRHPSEPLRHWLERIGNDRQISDWLGTSAPDDVEDPIGRSVRQYRRTAERLSAAIDTIVTALNAPLPPREA